MIFNQEKQKTWRKKNTSMPVYEFFCTACNKKFERYLSYEHSGDAVTCPAGHAQIQKVFAPPQIVFKGSGFYITDKKQAAKPPVHELNP